MSVHDQVMGTEPPALIPEAPVSVPPEPRPSRRPVPESYQEACARYTNAVRAAQRTRAEAEERYRVEVAAVRQGAQQAVVARDLAAKQAADAERLVTEADDTSAELWRKLGSYVGDKRLGPTPPPDPDITPRSEADVQKLLSRTRHVVTRMQRGELPFPPPKHAVPIAAGIGAASGLVACCLATLLLGGGGDDNARAVFQAVALVVLFVGALTGIPLVAGWLSMRHHVGVGAAHVGAAVAGAVVTIGVLSPWMLL